MNRPIAASSIGQTHGWIASGATSRERVFRSARRHSRLVRILRIAVPLVVVVGLGGVAFVTWLDPAGVLAKLPTTSGTLAISGSKITMDLPRVAGFTRDSRAYELTAKTAVQDIATPDMIELKELRARMDLQDGSAVTLAALSGLYHSKADKLTLKDQVNVVSSAGYRGKFREAVVDMRKGHIVSEQPVEITLPSGFLQAKRMEIIDSGDVVRFEGGVVLTLVMGPEKPAAQDKKP